MSTVDQEGRRAALGARFHAGFCTAHTALELIVGSLIVAMPALLGGLTGASLTENEGLQLGRLFGGSLVCVALLTWQVRKLSRPESLIPALSTVCAYHGLVTVILVYGQIMGFRDALAWVFPLGHASFAVGFAMLWARAARGRAPAGDGRAPALTRRDCRPASLEGPNTAGVSYNS